MSPSNRNMDELQEASGAAFMADRTDCRWRPGLPALYSGPATPRGAVNGVFVNPCCADLTLKYGHGGSRSTAFDYVVEERKRGPRLLLSRNQNLIVGRGSLQVVRGSQYITVDSQPNPRWIEIDGVRFVRRHAEHHPQPSPPRSGRGEAGGAELAGATLEAAPD